MARQAHELEVIDLVSDDDGFDTPAVKREDPDDPNAWLDMADFFTPPADTQPENQGLLPPRWYQALGGDFVIIDGEEVFIPDEDDVGRFMLDAVPGAANADVMNDEGIARVLAHQDEESGPQLGREHNVPLAIENPIATADDCLQRVLSIFPDISHEYVLHLYAAFEQEGDYEILPGQARLDNIIEQLVSDPTYPKQEKRKKSLKRKRGDNDSANNNIWGRADRPATPHFLKGSIQAMLKAEFPDIPINYINDTFARERHLYQAFIALAKTIDGSDETNRPYRRGRASTKHLADAVTLATACGWPELLEELNAARLRRQTMLAEKAAEHAAKQAERENLERAIAAGETSECTACFDDLPMNRQIHCNGSVPHFICFECALTYIKSEVGESRCRVLCTAGCGSGFATNQLNLLSDKQLLEKLSQLQQEKDIRDAGLDDLEECPFCDYKVIMPPIEEDFEFRCLNPECEKVSCRRCKSVSHIPISCEEHAKEHKINSRHKVEEAMTAALIRSCNKCQKKFIKDYGCNKMACPSCGNLQCYVCSATVKDYNHFDQAARAGAASRSKLCPLYDNVEERHEREVKEAEAAARAQVVEDNPDVTAEDLEIKVSDAVKKMAADRNAPGGGPAGFAGEVFGGFPNVADAQRYLFDAARRRHAAPRLARNIPGHDGAADDDVAAGDEARVGPPPVPPIALRLHDQQRRASIHEQVARRQRDLQRLQQAAVAADGRQQAARQQAARNEAARQQAAQPQRFDFPGHVQGYIPVLGMNPPLAPGPGAFNPQNQDAGLPAAPPQIQQGFFGPALQIFGDLDGFRGPFHLGAADAGMHLDGVAPQPPNPPVLNNNNVNQQFGHEFQLFQPPPPPPPQFGMPGGWPMYYNQQPANANPWNQHQALPDRGAAAAAHRQDHFQQLEMLRQQHDQTVRYRNEQMVRDLEMLQQQVREARR